MTIAREMELTEDQVHGLRLAGLVHDVGKINVPAEILSKPGKLSPITQIVYQHHERLDGSGYPR